MDAAKANFRRELLAMIDEIDPNRLVVVQAAKAAS